MRIPDTRWREFFRNPLWYAVTVTILGVLTVNLGFLWWLAGLVALVWGSWLIWHFFAGDKEKTDSPDQLMAYLDQARVYQAQIDQLLRASSNMSNRAHRLHLVAQINLWTDAVQTLVGHIASLRRDELIRRDMAAVPRAIETLEAQLPHEIDPAIRAQLERTLTNRKNQLASLGLLQSNIKRAEIQLESTLSLLGTIYSQILIGQSTNHVADYGRLSIDVDEEVRRLQDQLEALWEVKGTYWAGTTYLAATQVESRPPGRFVH